ncbi:DUF5642 family protein [Mycobacterium sp. CPCC 205710]|uniref:DUF5642 family protein n=1 Tax=Mycobacterium deserti TaxID=2978347 RepID=A0ABT2M508_9MYCO|nr:DUF5642 family protein [Mycobacterium deserti]MCT7657351.1 DUF5642 family protein [Mycobacterium deserti]
MKCSIAAIVICLAACGVPSEPDPEPLPSTRMPPVNPARIDRVRGDLPDGYEVAGLAGGIAPAVSWGLGAEWTADPPQCGVLADPVTGDARGWSASGAGGIVYAAVADGRSPDPALLSQCGRWTVSGGKTSGDVSLGAAPSIDGAQTVGMATATTTVVEGGTETRSHADTASAYLDGHVVFVTVVTDPGSPNPQLGQDFAAELLVRTVSALRG